MSFKVDRTSSNGYCVQLYDLFVVVESNGRDLSIASNHGYWDKGDAELAREDISKQIADETGISIADVMESTSVMRLQKYLDGGDE